AVGGDERILGLSSVAARGQLPAPAGPPCNCDPSTFFDVGAAVAAAKQATNGASSWTHIGIQDLHLTGGNYYVTAADVVGLTAIHVDAPSSVFVDGSLRQVGAELWKLAPGATLDLFVSGNVASVGALVAGNPADPTAFRLYVGGSGDTVVGSVGAALFFGSIYAPRSAIAYVGDAQIVGSIFAKTIKGVGVLTLEYRDPIAPPTSCDPPTGGDPDVPTFL
ncbi:MAG TPA: hypothetical protein VFV99_00470, partial [Kofleriaceae bacterium]|nr:hypothetical protein [Kofleriaceae bacterium]